MGTFIISTLPREEFWISTMNAQLQATSPTDHLQTTPLEPLLGKSLDELRALVKAMDEPAFRAEQLHQWIYVHCVRDFEEMTNLKRTFREKLAARYQVGSLQ